MSARSRVTRALHRRAAVAGAAALTASTVALVGAPPAGSAPDPDCPPAVPVADVAEGAPVNGLTVSKGTEPEPFEGEVLGTIENGIAAGIDMVMVDVTAGRPSEIGVWAGMSGSPVYAGDGRLVGAVAYGLALGPNSVAGVTPAEQMYRLLDSAPSDVGTTADTVEIPSAMRTRMTRRGDMTAAQADGGFERLPLPVGVSGLGSQRLEDVGARIDKRAGGGERLYHRAGSASGAAGDPADIFAGSNLAATLSYGDLTVGGVGTTTAVCGEEVLAFGHPMLWTGSASLAMHSADAVYVQQDPTLFPFKVANITGVTGRITDDRMRGVRGVLGAAPAGAAVTSQAWAHGAFRQGDTTVTVRELLPDLAAFAHLANLDSVFDGISDGTSRVRWVVSGRRPDGRPFVLDRVDRAASRWDITFESAFLPYQQLSRMLSYPGGRARITDVDLRSQVSDKLALFRVAGVQKRTSGRWVPVQRGGIVTAHRGGTMRLLVRLTSYQNLAGRAWARVDLPVPNRRPGRVGVLRVAGGDSVWDSGGRPRTFAALVQQLDRETRNDQLVVTLRSRDTGALWRKRRPVVHRVVGGDFGFRVRIIR